MAAPLLEKHIQAQILDYLARKKIFHWRNNTGAVVSEYKGKKRMFSFGAVGSSDIFALHEGIFYAIEVKRPGGKLSGNQMDFQMKVQDHGGRFILAFDLDDIKTIFP